MAELSQPQAQATSGGHAAADVDVRRIVAAGLVLGFVVAAVIAGVFALHAWHVGGPEERFGPAVSPQAADRFPEPRLQSRRAQERERYFAQQRAKAAEYAWIDRAHGIVRIPVERAMRLLEQEQAGAAADRGAGR